MQKTRLIAAIRNDPRPERKIVDSVLAVQWHMAGTMAADAFCLRPGGLHCVYVVNVYAISWVEAAWISSEPGRLHVHFILTPSKLVYRLYRAYAVYTYLPCGSGMDMQHQGK